jgi:hypothetical protein
MIRVIYNWNRKIGRQVRFLEYLMGGMERGLAWLINLVYLQISGVIIETVLSLFSLGTEVNVF